MFVVRYRTVDNTAITGYVINMFVVRYRTVGNTAITDYVILITVSLRHITLY